MDICRSLKSIKRVFQYKDSKSAAEEDFAETRKELICNAVAKVNEERERME